MNRKYNNKPLSVNKLTARLKMYTQAHWIYTIFPEINREQMLHLNKMTI